jgi:hypothetical protein
LEAVGLWFAAMDADDSIGSSLVGEGVPGWVCSLLIITALFSILHRHNSVRPISSLLARINATSGRLRVQSLVGDATDSPPGTGDGFRHSGGLRGWSRGLNENNGLSRLQASAKIMRAHDRSREIHFGDS